MNKMTKIIIVVIIAAIVIGAIWYGVTREPIEKGVIKIGAILPLSGKYASYGVKMRKGIDLAVEDANKKLRAVKIQIIYEDTQGDPTASTSAIKKLINLDKVKGIITIFSGVSGAIAPIAQENKVPLITHALASQITEVGDFIFQNHPRATDEGIADAKFLMKKGAKRVAVLYCSADSCVGMSESFKEIFKGEIVFNEMYERGTYDFRTPLTKIKRTNPDWLYLPGYDKEVGYMVKQARELGINIPVLSVEGVNSQNFLDIAGEHGEGLIYSSFILDPDKADSRIRDIFKRYQKRYDEEINVYAGESYDTVMLFAKVVEDGTTDTQVIRDRLAAIENFKGVSGTITFDEERHTPKTFGYFTVKNGEFVSYEE